ncbi:MAG TPA: hypothetical protein VFP24_08250 [Gaiellaceae bacterium]|nr:hypothetical protein [Gaiellaceae bacterium]
MIVAMHVATGAAAGQLVRSRLAAVVLGAALHAAADRIPHEDFASRRFELQCGVGGVLALALRRGLVHPATLGAIASVVPDVEHVVRLPRPGGRKLFPSHRIPGFHRPGGIPARAQLLIAGFLLGLVLAQTDRDGGV